VALLRNFWYGVSILILVNDIVVDVAVIVAVVICRKRIRKTMRVDFIWNGKGKTENISEHIRGNTIRVNMQLVMQRIINVSKKDMSSMIWMRYRSSTVTVPQVFM